MLVYSVVGFMDRRLGAERCASRGVFRREDRGRLGIRRWVQHDEMLWVIGSASSGFEDFLWCPSWSGFGTLPLGLLSTPLVINLP